MGEWVLEDRGPPVPDVRDLRREDVGEGAVLAAW